jgi:glycosyltransferase involved in cell wall biosynthesis
MKIGFIIGRIGDVDGVALETEKWIKTLKQLGHEVFILSGRFQRSIVGKAHETLIPELSFFSPNCEWEQHRSFFLPPDDPSELLEHLHRESDGLAIRMFKWTMTNNIEVIISENASALPAHLTMGMAIKKLIKYTGIKIICHNHDFFWERGTRYNTPFKEVEKIVKETFPLQFPCARHAVINTYSKNYLKEKYDIDSVLVPNVMDFDQPFGEKDDYNKDLLQEIGAGHCEIPLFQITRIVKRKGIETAVELVEKLNNKNVKLIVTGSAADDERKGYFRKLCETIKKNKLEDRVVFAYRRILSNRGKTKNGAKIYSLSDAYASATACTYFSSYEGFGNAFLEAVLAKKPIFVNNYKPVFWPDIGSKGFKTVMIENNKLTDEALNEFDKIIHNKKLQTVIGEYNYNLGRLLFSYSVLKERLEFLLQNNW